MKYTFPATYGEECVLVPIDKALIPLVSGALKHFEQRSWWQSETDYELGYNAFAQLQADFMAECVSKLQTSLDNIYRLLDTTFNGTQYAAGAVDPLTGAAEITPPIPLAPPVSTEQQNAMRAHVGRLWQLAENATNGRVFPPGAGIQGAPALADAVSTRETIRALQGLTGGFFGIGATPVTLADLLKSGRVNTEADQGLINNGLEEVIGVLSGGGNIANVLTSLLDTGADIATDGGVIAANLASALAISVQLAEMLPMLRRIINTLDGGGDVEPNDSILRALRGDIAADEDRNVINALHLSGDNLAELVADVEEIRVKVQ